LSSEIDFGEFGSRYEHGFGGSVFISRRGFESDRDPERSRRDQVRPTFSSDDVGAVLLDVLVATSASTNENPHAPTRAAGLKL
jgi:hypothetical protein